MLTINFLGQLLAIGAARGVLDLLFGYTCGQEMKMLKIKLPFAKCIARN